MRRRRGAAPAVGDLVLPGPELTTPTVEDFVDPGECDSEDQARDAARRAWLSAFGVWYADWSEPYAAWMADRGIPEVVATREEYERVAARLRRTPEGRAAQWASEIQRCIRDGRDLPADVGP